MKLFQLLIACYCLGSAVFNIFGPGSGVAFPGLEPGVQTGMASGTIGVGLLLLLYFDRRKS